MLFAMSLQPALSLHRIAVCRVADSLKGWLRLPKTSSVDESFGFRRKCAGNHYILPGRFEKPRPCAELQPRSTARLICDIFDNLNLGERIHLPQVSAEQELQIKAQTRLASLMEEKLVTRISVLSTLLGGGKATERLLVRISIETHKTPPDFDQTALRAIRPVVAGDILAAVCTEN
jgi:hypothetical protein